MTRVLRPIWTAWRLIVTGELDGLIEAAGGRVRGLAGSARRWWLRDHPWIGWYVAARGNVVVIEGCRFDVSHPAITPGLRSRLWRGRYERSERALLETVVDPERPVFEFGGGIGVVATLVNQRLRDPHQHVVVEANPVLLPVLQRQRNVNGAAFTIEHAAIDYTGSSTVSLVVHDEFLAGRVGSEGTRSFEVPAISFRQLLRRYPWTGATLICDIEGVEVDLLRHEGHLVAHHCFAVLVEIHPEFRSESECRSVFEALESRGFEKVASLRKVHAFRRTTPPPAAAP